MQGAKHNPALTLLATAPYSLAAHLLEYRLTSIELNTLRRAGNDLLLEPLLQERLKDHQFDNSVQAFP